MIPSNCTAIKLRNALVKDYKGKALSAYGSNPYVSWQSLNLTVRLYAKLRKTLAAEGWTLDQSNTQESSKDIIFTFKKGGDVRDGGNVVVVDIYGHVTVMGPKKAKRMDVPYYD